MIPDVSNRVRRGPLRFGFINTSRFAASAAGALIADTAFAHASPFSLYLGLNAFTLLALTLFLGKPTAIASTISPSRTAG